MSVENIWTREASIERLHKTTSKTRHHDQMKSIQVNSARHVKSCRGRGRGKPFLEESKNLLTRTPGTFLMQLWHLGSK